MDWLIEMCVLQRASWNVCLFVCPGLEYVCVELDCAVCVLKCVSWNVCLEVNVLECVSWNEMCVLKCVCAEMWGALLKFALHCTPENCKMCPALRSSGSMSWNMVGPSIPFQIWPELQCKQNCETVQPSAKPKQRNKENNWMEKHKADLIIRFFHSLSFFVVRTWMYLLTVVRGLGNVVLRH